MKLPEAPGINLEPLYAINEQQLKEYSWLKAANESADITSASVVGSLVMKYEKELKSRRIPDSCTNSCIYKQFSQNMNNAKRHDDEVKFKEREQIINDILQWVQKHSYPQSSREHSPFVITMGCAVDFIQSLRSDISDISTDLEALGKVKL